MDIVSSRYFTNYIIYNWLNMGFYCMADEKIDSILPPSFALLSAFPYFFTAMILLYIFGFNGMFPISMLTVVI